MKYLSLIFVALGILLRAELFLENRSLRVDEAAYFDCLAARSSQDILLNRNYNFYSPPAPIGFSWVEKKLINCLGQGEYVLRLFPLVLSLGSVLLFYVLTGQYLTSWARPLAVGAFAFADQLVYLSADMHPYSTEVFFSILVLWIYNRLESQEPGLQDRASFILIAVIAVWFSFTVVFVLGAIAIVSLSLAIFQRKWGLWRDLAIVHVCWLISFASVYGYTIQPIIHAGITHGMWANYFLYKISFCLIYQ